MTTMTVDRIVTTWPASRTNRLPWGHSHSSVRVTYQSGGGFFFESDPKNSLTISGIAMSRPSDVTSFAIEPAPLRYRNSNRSSNSPMAGPTMTTANRNAHTSGHSWSLRTV